MITEPQHKVLAILAEQTRPVSPWRIGIQVWGPSRHQPAKIAERVLTALKNKGLAMWARRDETSYGWVITQKGREEMLG